jgi:hypothetical protein
MHGLTVTDVAGRENPDWNQRPQISKDILDGLCALYSAPGVNTQVGSVHSRAFSLVPRTIGASRVTPGGGRKRSQLQAVRQHGKATTGRRTTPPHHDLHTTDSRQSADKRWHGWAGARRCSIARYQTA